MFIRPFVGALLAALFLFAAAPAAAVEAQTGMSAARLQRLSDAMQKHIAAGRIHGAVMLVHRGGAEAYSAVLGMQDAEAQIPMRRNTIFRIYSMSKPVTAVAVMQLVEQGRVQLSDPITKWLPEFKAVQVMRAPLGEVADTVPQARPITVRDLLTHTSGTPYNFTAPPKLRAAMEQAASPQTELDFFALSMDEATALFAQTPLLHQPGTRWHYGIGLDLAGVLVERVSGMRFGDFLQENLFAPLQMNDTGFGATTAEQQKRLAVNYTTAEAGQGGALQVHEHPRESNLYTTRPQFESGGGGLVSTADDYLRFARMIVNGGALDGVRVLSRKSVELITRNSLTAEERSVEPPGSEGLFRGGGFGLGVRVIEDSGLARTLVSPGTSSWGGAAGTWYFADPAEEMAGVLMIQAFRSPHNWPIRQDFENLVYQAIND